MGGMRAEKCNTDIVITDSQKQGLNTWDIRGGVYQSSVTMGKRQGEIIGCGQLLGYGKVTVGKIVLGESPVLQWTTAHPLSLLVFLL